MMDPLLGGSIFICRRVGEMCLAALGVLITHVNLTPKSSATHMEVYPGKVSLRTLAKLGHPDGAPLSQSYTSSDLPDPLTGRKDLLLCCLDSWISG